MFACSAAQITARPARLWKAAKVAAEDITLDWLKKNGWRVEVVVRTSGASEGNKDKYFWAPKKEGGKKFRSVAAVRRHYAAKTCILAASRCQKVRFSGLLKLRFSIMLITKPQLLDIAFRRAC